MDHITALAHDIKASDHKAFTALYDEVNHELLRYAWHLTRDKNLMYDIVQEAFTVLWDKRLTIDTARSIRAFLYRIVRNLAYKYHRKKQHEDGEQAVSQSPAVYNTGPSSFDKEVLQEQLNRILAKLSDRRREVFELSRLGLLKHNEIAEVLDISPKTVRNHLVGALQFIREQFEIQGLR